MFERVTRRLHDLFSKRKRRIHTIRPQLESLEERFCPAQFWVTGTADNLNPGTLRWALGQSNSNPGQGGVANVISFNILPQGTVQTITIDPALGPLTASAPVILDGVSQGAGPMNWLDTPWINIDANGVNDGLDLAGSDCYVDGLAVYSCLRDGIAILPGQTDNTIEWCYAGTDVAQGADMGNSRAGISVAGANNVVSSCVASGDFADGILISGSGATNNLVRHFDIGTRSNGQDALGNWIDGIAITGGASGNTIGGLANVISANGGDGVRIDGSNNNQVIDNWIGVKDDGMTPLGNGNNGIEIVNGASANIIGMSLSVANVISANADDGILMSNTPTSANAVDGNYIGVGSDGATALGNGNAGVEIDAAIENWVGEPGLQQGNVISGNPIGVKLDDGATINNVVNNMIGTDLGGTVEVGSGYGVLIDNATTNTIGGDGSGTGVYRNVISGNSEDGVRIQNGASRNQVLGNYIGTDSGGSQPLGNGGNGVGIYDSPGNIIGDGSEGGGNVISANGVDYAFTTARRNGVFIKGLSSSNNLIQGNYIGTDADGDVDPNAQAALGNMGSGVYVEATAGANNVIGGNGLAARNLIDANLVYEIFNDVATTFIDWNYVGVDLNGVVDPDYANHQGWSDGSGVGNYGRNNVHN
jgi:hypothetical protein